MKFMRNGNQFTQNGMVETYAKQTNVLKAIENTGAIIQEVTAAGQAAGMSKTDIQKELMKALRGEPTVFDTVEAIEEPGTETITQKRVNENKSKVCVIANRFARTGMSRPEAFRKAWVIVKAQTVDTKVAGVTAGRRQEAIERLTRYDAELIRIDLQRDSANEYDSNAVAVVASVQGKGSYIMGYLPRMLAAAIAPLIDAGKRVTATFKEIRGKYHNYHNYGLAVAVSI